MYPVACLQCGNPISPTSFECPRCGAIGPNQPGRPSKGITRGRWTLICTALFLLGLAFPPMRQHGEYAVDGRSSEVNHEYMPAWIGNANAMPDIGYTRNGQLETVTWNITREINHDAWYLLLGFVGLMWAVGMAIPRRRRPAPARRYPQEIVPKPPVAPPAHYPAAAPTRADDRSGQPPQRRSTPIYPGMSVPGDVGSVRRTPPPAGRYR